MSPHQQTHVIVGAGLAGAKAAETLREEGFEGRIVMIAAEPERPYERPPLSKEVLRGEAARETAFVHDASFYDERDIELVTGTAATAIDPGRFRVTLAGGRELAYDRLLLATGAEPRRLPVPGADLDGVRMLRTLADADALREQLRPGARVVVVGAGWIGSEVAASARTLGAEVTVIDRAKVPLGHVLGERIGAVYRDLHREHGVEYLPQTGVGAFEGDGRVSAVRTTDGRLLPCDLAVVGIGVAPRTELAEAAGLAVEDGVVCDERLGTTAPAVYAAGDVASAWHPFYGRHLRVEHWANALHQGPAAAQAMLGRPVVYDRIPYFYSDQYDVGMEYSGLAGADDQLVVRGDLERREFVAFWLRDDRVVAGMNVNVWDVNQHVQALIRSRAVVDRAALADPGTPLDALVPATAAS